MLPQKHPRLPRAHFHIMRSGHMPAFPAASRFVRRRTAASPKLNSTGHLVRRPCGGATTTTLNIHQLLLLLLRQLLQLPNSSLPLPLFLRPNARHDPAQRRRLVVDPRGVHEEVPRLPQAWRRGDAG